MSDLPFASLVPDSILTCVEQATGRRLLNVCRPHASYINRVYELQDENGEFIVVKFYRPGRWSHQALIDEQRFVIDCAEQELPVIAPLPFADGSFLSTFKKISFAVYPRCGGRLVDEYTDDQWLEFGRLLGRVHSVGKQGDAPGRNRLHPQQTSREQISYILKSGLIPEPLRSKFIAQTDELLNLLTPLFENLETIRLHGDCHPANLIYRPGESFFIIDFDDMVVGPPVQDIWMLLPDTIDESRMELALLLEGYETFTRFDRSTLKLIEPLRAMRYIHYISWCLRQYLEDGSTRIDETFGSYNYWQQEIADLEDQLQVIRKSLS